MLTPSPDAQSSRVALLLAGGDGTRLQDLTCKIAGTPIPKQYCRLWKGSSLLETTISRASLFVPHDRIHVVINENHADMAKDQIRALPESNIIVQPLNRDTGPGMIFALLHLERKHPHTTVAVFPTDHYIDKDWVFIMHVLHAVNMISGMPNKIAILGIVPDRPESGYGYIMPADPLKKVSKICRGESFFVKAFAEKPNSADAQEIIARGGLWNTFVMVFKLSRMLELLRELVPDEFSALAELRDAPAKATEIYQTLKPWNLSTQILAHVPQHLIVLRVSNVNWSDWGTLESVERTYKALNLAPFWERPSPLENKLAG
jgi:mannose-1-phosphate guanylyltransferase